MKEVKKLGVTGIDMESSCMLTLGASDGSKNLYSDSGYGTGELKRNAEGSGEDRCGEDLLCRTALEGIYNYHRKQQK